MKKIYLRLAICFVLISNFSYTQTEVTFYTSMGTFVAEMYDTLQPITSGNFVNLVKAKFYDDIIFHRVINNFMIQGGDPLGTGYGGPGYTITDEFDANTSNVQKAIAMANSGPNTGGSQFFINLVNNIYLNPNHPVFGKVVTTFTVVQAIGAVATNSSNRPLTDVVMDSLRVTKSGPLTINEFTSQSLTVNVYPNPATSESAIFITANSEKEASIFVYDQKGGIVYRGRRKLLSGTNYFPLKEILDGNLSNGLYYIAVTEGELISQKKFILLR